VVYVGTQTMGWFSKLFESSNSLLVRLRERTAAEDKVISLMQELMEAKSKEETLALVRRVPTFLLFAPSLFVEWCSCCCR
jgi:hypothetical protein